MNAVGISIRFSLVRVLKGFFRLFNICSTFGHPGSGVEGVLDFVEKIRNRGPNPKQTLLLLKRFIVKRKEVFQRWFYIIRFIVKITVNSDKIILNNKT